MNWYVVVATMDKIICRPHGSGLKRVVENDQLPAGSMKFLSGVGPAMPKMVPSAFCAMQSATLSSSRSCGEAKQLY